MILCMAVMLQLLRLIMLKYALAVHSSNRRHLMSLRNPRQTTPPSVHAQVPFPTSGQSLDLLVWWWMTTMKLCSNTSTTTPHAR
jgi:hypothetical protein